MSASDLAVDKLVQWLRQRHALTMQTEARALDCLEAGDVPGHNAGMRQKAELLANMAEEARPHLEGLPGETRFQFAMALENFSASARTALRLNSLFYMSALLYPDDHKKGDPDNLSLCIERMAEQKTEFRAG